MRTESLVSGWDVGLTSRLFIVLPQTLESNYNFGQLIMRLFSCLTALSLLIFCLVNAKMVVLAEGHSQTSQLCFNQVLQSGIIPAGCVPAPS